MKIEYPIRLQSYLAKSGIGSRRSCEELITQGRVRVNNFTVRTLGTKVNENDVVYVDDVLAEPAERTYYFALNKPAGFVCSNSDPYETAYARDLIDIPDRNLLFNVGRLDKESEGLLLFTNDGDFAYQITHPSSETEKEYIVFTNSDIDKRDMDAAYRGEVRPYKLKSYSLKSKRQVNVVLTEGKNREIRNLFELLGYRVTKLIRIRIGDVELEDLGPGKSRRLTKKEVESLLAKTAKPREKSNESRH